MRTSIVCERFGSKGYERAKTPDDEPGNWRNVPHYVPPHRATGIRSNGDTEWDEPEGVSVCTGIHRPSRGKINEIRINTVTVDALDLIDRRRDEIKAELEELRRQEQAYLESAYNCGRPVTIKELKEWRERRLSEKK